MDYILFCARNTYAMSAHAILEELGVPYRVNWVELFSAEPDPEFLVASPHCRVPALAGPDGTVFETGAIALYLAERHGGDSLLVPPGDPSRGRFLQWLHYLASTLQPDVMIQFHPEFYFDDAASQERLMASSRERLKGVLETLDAAIGDGPWFMGEKLTVLDFLLALQTIWPETFPGSIKDYPNIDRLTTRVIERPAVQRILKLHQ